MQKLFDSHFHIIDDAYPLVENNGFLPENFTSNQYLDAVDGYSVAGGAIVSGSFQAFDQSYLINALNELNEHAGRYVGVTQLPDSVSDEEILTLDSVGVRAVRFNVYRGGSEHVGKLRSFASRVHEIAGWHVELYIGSEKLDDLATVIKTLPSASIDHLGMDRACENTVLDLVDSGVKIKATGFGRIGFEPISMMKKIHQVSPYALMFGTDLPSTRAREPFTWSDLSLIMNNFGEDDLSRILWQNAAEHYRLE